MVKRAYKDSFDKAFSQSLSKLTEIHARRLDGSKKEISLDPEDDWVKSQDKEAAHLTIEFPKGMTPTGKIVVGYMGEDYQGEPVSFPVDRKIHVIRGRVMEAVKGQVIHEGEGPLLIKKGELAQVDASDDSVIVIDLKPNAPEIFPDCSKCSNYPCSPGERDQCTKKD